MKEAKIYDSYRVEKADVDGVAVRRFVVFSGLDPNSVLDDGIEIGEYIPSIHAVPTELRMA